MKKKWITACIIFGIVILALTMTGMIIGVVFGDKIKEMAVRELNKRLATEVKVNGKISFSVFRNFPHASLIFHDAEIRETLPEKGNLLSCEQISLLFNFWDLFGNNYSMKKILIENGQIAVRVNKEGKNNFAIFKSAEGNNTSDFSLSIRDAALSNMTISYDDDRADQHYYFVTSSSTLAGDFSSDNFLLEIKSDLKSKQLMVHGIDYLPERMSQIHGKLQVDLRKNLYTINDARLLIEGNPFFVSGTVHSSDQGNELNLKISAENLSIEEIAALLPSRYMDYLSHFTSKGNIQFSSEIRGMVSATSNPRVMVSFGVKNGTISHDKMKESFEKVNLSGIYSNGKQASLVSSYIELNSFSTTFDGNPVSGTLSVKNFDDPFLDMKLDGEVSLQKLAPLFSSEIVKELEGTVTFRDFYFRANTDQINTREALNKIEAGGSFVLKEVALTTTKAVYDDINGAFDITNNQITINQLSFRASESDLRFSGTISNFIPFLLSSMNDSIKTNQKIGLNVNLISNQLKWEELVGTDGSGHSASGDSYYSIPSLFYMVTGQVFGKIGKFSYQKFNASDIQGQILFLGNNIYFNEFRMKAEKGDVSMNGKLDIAYAKRNRLDLTARLDRLDISQLFYEFNDFNQNSLTHQRLKGLVTADIALQATWDMRRLNKDKLYAVAEVEVENGELNNFDPMMALAKFVKISELKNIRFSRMQNQIEIKNQLVSIPSMKIYTNALNVQLSGTHSFNNIIDYKVQLNLLKLLTSKFAKSSLQPDGTDQSTEGFLNLYLSMTGPATDPLIKYDKQAVKEKIAADLKNEKNELKDVLKKEFDKQENDQNEIKDWKAPEEIQYMEFGEDTIVAENNTSDEDESITKQNQKKELDNFKSIFKQKTPPK